MSSRDDTPTFGEMLEEIVDLLAGAGVMLLPAMLLAIPCLVLLLPLLLLPLPLVILVAPFLLIRALWRRRPSIQRAAPPRGSLSARPT